MRYMKMPRSQCEAENVQFVQELAEADGPFEAPININFRDLTKLDLPPLVWNQSDACPRKMKITNTGHTVIVSAKWKCERPYLTGGPLIGKYVFSQIHFHWGQTDCRGSEHQICGEQFPLEMHVAHFKTEYITQESALREKDGMVVVVYLFKLQDEPNHSLKKIISSLPFVQNPSTSCAIEPRPVVSLCHPFTDDYFMYWGSVVTSTCAHILLWIICREPFGISKEQVCEFRKIMDSSQQPICKNSREIQPLHKRNVFHVNPSKNLDDPLLPIKKRLGCYCKESSLNTSNSCHCQGANQNQEDVEGNFSERVGFEGIQAKQGCFANQTFVVQTATMRSLSIVLKKPEDDSTKNHSLDTSKKVNSEVYNEQVNVVSKSCCFFPTLEANEINDFNEKKKVSQKNKLFISAKAFSQIMHSLEALKNQTFKKLKKIESINQEIKEMKPFCHDTEDKKWVRKVEKMLMKQKRFTIKSSQGCLSELKKLAKERNFDKYFDSKALPAVTSSRKMMWLTNNAKVTAELPLYDTPIECEGSKNKSSKHSDISKTIRFSSKAQKLIESFFEDIKDSEDLQETVTKDPNFKKIKSICNVGRDSKSISDKSKGYITQKMFNLGNLGNRFFTEVTTDEIYLDENWKYETQNEELVTAQNDNETKNILGSYESEKLTEVNIESKFKNKDKIPLHRVNIPIPLPKAKKEENRGVEILTDQDLLFKNEKNQKFSLKKTSKKIQLKKSFTDNEEKFYEVTDGSLIKSNETKVTPSKSRSSSLNWSTDSMETQRIVTKKVWKSKRGISEQKKQKSSTLLKVPSIKLRNKTSFKKFEGVYTQKKFLKNKEKKNHRHENRRCRSLCGLSLSSKKDEGEVSKKLAQERITKTKFKLEEQTRSINPRQFATDYTLISPERKKLTAHSSTKDSLTDVDKSVHLKNTETRTIISEISGKHEKTEPAKANEENSKKEESTRKLFKDSFSEDRQSTILESAEYKSRTISRVFSNRYRANSVDSKSSYSKIRALTEVDDSYPDLGLNNKTLKRVTPKLIEGKSLLKIHCRSLTNNTFTSTSDFPQRLLLEPKDSRKKSNQDASVKKLKESFRTLKESPREDSNDTIKNLNKEEQQREENQELKSQEKYPKCQNTFDKDIDFATENSSQMNNELPFKVQIQNEKEKNIMQKRCAMRKNQFLEKGNEEPFEILRLTDSDKSFTRNSFKGDSDFLVSDNKNYQTSVSCFTLKKKCESRPHSVETLHSLKKTQKRKGKKRPHCSKKRSRHYVRKNYSVLKKPSKPFNFLSLKDEEQLKIISVNVAKYIKQKLLDEKSQLEAGKNSPINIEEELRKLNRNIVPEKKSEVTATHESTTVNPQKAKKFRIPVLKSMEKIKLKEELKKKPNTAESQGETAKHKPEFSSSPRPVNNFIKLNKQMAATYKRTIPVPVKKMQSKEKEKSSLGTKPTDEMSKPKTKIQKKVKEKLPPQKTKEERKYKPPIFSSPISQIPSPKAITRKERQIKGPANSRKADFKTRTVSKAQVSSSKVEELNESVDFKGKVDSEKTPPQAVNPKETPRAKKSKLPTCNLNYNSTTPEKCENQDEKNVQNNIVKLDEKRNAEEEIKREALFKKELEYFITMQMYLNNEISKRIDNPLHYFNSKVQSSDNNVTESPLTNDSLQNPDFSSKDIVIVKTKNIEECLSSCSELNEPPEKFIQEKDTIVKINEDNNENQNILAVQISEEFHDSNKINSTLVQEGPEDSPSDSNYDCKISITLNTNLDSKESETYCLERNCNSQTTSSLEGSFSRLTDLKPENGKKENEMTLEMKQKLLEIFEGEIKREIGMSSGVSSGPSSDCFGFNAMDSEGNLRSQTTESSSDSTDALCQIPSTMIQYLNYLREIKRLPNESTDFEDF